MQIKNVMTTEVDLVDFDTPVTVAARKMRVDDVGALPVGKDNRMVGMLTDRDIVLRVVAQGKNPSEVIAGDVMSEGILYCYEDQDGESVARNMGAQQVRRLPVVDREKNLVGIVSLSDLSTTAGSNAIGEALESLSRNSSPGE